MARQVIANDTVFTFGSATFTAISAVDFGEEGEEVDATGFGDTEQQSEIGMPKRTFTVTVLGAATGVSVGTEGAISLAALDDAITEVGQFAVQSRQASLPVNGQATTTLTFVKVEEPPE